MLIDFLELFFIDGYQIFINDMKTVIYRGNIIMGTTNITATERLYQIVFPSPRLHSRYWHQIIPHSSLYRKSWIFCLPSITESWNGDTSNRHSQIDPRRQKLDILLIALLFAIFWHWLFCNGTQNWVTGCFKAVELATSRKQQHVYGIWIDVLCM